jgi:type IV secretory pathway ATPase VirB11/archaellum biosynthesis ATPase
MKQYYKIITYGDLYKFLKDRNEVKADANFKAFFEAMHRHTHENVNDYLYYDMLEKFVRRIKAYNDKK